MLEYTQLSICLYFKVNKRLSEQTTRYWMDSDSSSEASAFWLRVTAPGRESGCWVSFWLQPASHCRSSGRAARCASPPFSLSVNQAQGPRSSRVVKTDEI